MKFSVFIVTPPDYIHSQCFIEVAETLCHGLRALGHEAEITTAVVPGTRHIILGGNLMVHYLVPVPRDSIHYNLEQLENNHAVRLDEYLSYLNNFAIWEYSPANMEFLERQGIHPRALLPISYYDGLTRIAPAPVKDIDVLFIGSMNDRRAAILNGMHARGLKVVHLFEKYGAERDAHIARAKLLLNMHYYPAHILEQVRISYYLANRVPVLSEVSADPATDAEWSQGVCFSSYDNLIESAVTLCSDDDERQRMAEAGFEFMKPKSIVPHLEAALAKTPRRF